MSDIRIIDTDFSVVGILDNYESFIWTDRFREPGDFEIYTPANGKFLDYCQQNRYLAVDSSYHNMIIETISIETSYDSGQKIKITGRSLESILDRRIVWNRTTVSGNMQNAIKKILTQAFITPSRTERAIPNFKFLDSTDPEITNLTINRTEFTGDQIDTIVKDICEAFGNVGYRILFGYQMNYIHYGESGYEPFDDYDFVFELYTGNDYSYEQFYNPYVIFSPSFDNIVNTNYVDSIEGMKNTTLVLGNRKRIIVGGKDEDEEWLPGLFRRELYTDARDLQSSKYDTSGDYKKALVERGYEKLIEASRVTSYEGEVEAQRSFVYGRDFLIGDIIQIENEYGIAGKARVVEWVRSESTSGIDAYPTFDGIQLIDKSETDDGGWS